MKNKISGESFFQRDIPTTINLKLETIIFELKIEELKS